MSFYTSYFTQKQGQRLALYLEMTYPTFKDVLVILVAVLGALWSTKNLPLIWSGRTRRYDHVPGWWLWGGPLWRGFVRGMPVGIGGWWLFVISYIGILLAEVDV